MKTYLITIAMLVSITSVFSQSHFKLGGAYFGDALIRPGLVAELEYEQDHAGQFTLSNRLDVGFFSYPGDHLVLFTDLHRGYRKYLENGLFVEQSFGFGLMWSFYDQEDFWYQDNLGNFAYTRDGAVIDLIPSVSLGLGYNFGSAPEGLSLWCRPKIFWQLPQRNPAQPHIAVQVGLSYTL